MMAARRAACGVPAPDRDPDAVMGCPEYPALSRTAARASAISAAEAYLASGSLARAFSRMGAQPAGVPGGSMASGFGSLLTMA